MANKSKKAAKLLGNRSVDRSRRSTCAEQSASLDSSCKTLSSPTHSRPPTPARRFATTAMDLIDIDDEMRSCDIWDHILDLVRDEVDEYTYDYKRIHPNLDLCDDRPCNFDKLLGDPNCRCISACADNEYYFDNYLPRVLRERWPKIPTHFHFPTLMNRNEQVQGKLGQTSVHTFDPAVNENGSSSSYDQLMPLQIDTSDSSGGLSLEGVESITPMHHKGDPVSTSTPISVGLTSQHSDDDLPCAQRTPTDKNAPSLRTVESPVYQADDSLPYIEVKSRANSSNKNKSPSLRPCKEHVDTPGPTEANHQLANESLASSGTPLDGTDGVVFSKNLNKPSPPRNQQPNKSTQGTPKQSKSKARNNKRLFFPLNTSDVFGDIHTAIEALKKHCNERNIGINTPDGKCSTIGFTTENTQGWDALFMLQQLGGKKFCFQVEPPNYPVRYQIQKAPRHFTKRNILITFPGAYHIYHNQRRDKRTNNLVNTGKIEFTLDKALDITVEHKIDFITCTLEKTPLELIDCFVCHELGHHGKTCTNKRRCGKCTKQHLTKTCKVSQSRVQCARCNGGPQCNTHTSYAYVECPVRQTAIRKYYSRQGKGNSDVQKTQTAPRTNNHTQNIVPPLMSIETYPPMPRAGTSRDVPLQTGPPPQQTVRDVPAQTRPLPGQPGTDKNTPLPPTQATLAPQHVSLEAYQTLQAERNSLCDELQRVRLEVQHLSQMYAVACQERQSIGGDLRCFANEINDIKAVNDILIQRVNELQEMQRTFSAGSFTTLPPTQAYPSYHAQNAVNSTAQNFPGPSGNNATNIQPNIQVNTQTQHNLDQAEFFRDFQGFASRWVSHMR